MATLHTESTIFGQLVRRLTGGKVFLHAEERDPNLLQSASSAWAVQGNNLESAHERQRLDGSGHQSSPTSRNHSAPNFGDGSRALIVDWYSRDDPENPQNWSNALKHSLMFQICLLNFAVYIASSIYVPGEPDLMEEFGVSSVVATLGLSLFTIGYGTGPMLWSPLSEMPQLGRTGIFFYTLLAFIVFQLPVGFAPNITCFLVFRFVTGSSYLVLWSSAGVMGPVFGPVIGGFLAPAMGWRWTIWVFTFLCIFVLGLMFFFLPETSGPKILHDRARRLRKATGNPNFMTKAELEAGHSTRSHWGDIMRLLARAFTLTFTEPIIFLVDLYAGLLYGVLFIWFESFPLVFGEIYHFTPQQQGLVFLGILVFTAISVPALLWWLKTRLVPRATAEDKSSRFKPEAVLPPAFIGSVILPACLFWFGWSSRPDIHWIAPVIGSGTFAVGIVTLFNSVYNYIGIIYAQYAASVFAGAALFRAGMGAAFPLFARALFEKLGVGPGNSLLGGIAVLFVPVPFIFHQYGERIRRWSKHAD
ncbi:major facilitator superfamily domain-containing protein [Microdochium trichocladiopsis]|uniref:Major facilitator superfamily domain-containing protein n=1 Tax=Microdochium trichocladiopsis TaxID=1682393 RepID=A0A9P8XXM3_9PEZI|nr:major facilitator superfamily domain-containing protein [Microdochium trichocladiopsis]KAH7024708.1 major facilitator superfamily domain-containing protein [Microdochium trichocladiopsis]